MKSFNVGDRVLITFAGSFTGEAGRIEEENTGSYLVRLDNSLVRYYSASQMQLEPAIEDTQSITEVPEVKNEVVRMTLPTDSNERKNYPLFSGLIRYFPAALAGVANISKIGNDKHNPGQPMHHARKKSRDHGDCILRHLTDIEDLMAARDRGINVHDQQILTEVGQMAWRALALAQAIHEKLGAPLAPGASEE
jgi:hypothetical protein